MRRFVATSLVATLGLAASGARADEPKPPPSPAPSAPAPAPAAPAARDTAREHYRRGKTLQAQGSYADAIAEYEQGFALVPTPEFLFNIAQCYRLSGDAPSAVDYYRRYLDAAPAGAGADEARGHIVTLTREIDARRREAAAQAPPAKAAPDPAEAHPAPAPAAPPFTDVAPAPATPSFGIWQWTGVSAGAAGLVAAGFATYYAVRADRLAQEVSIKPEDQWDDVLTAKYHEGQRDAYISIGLFVGAGVLVGGGVAAYFWGPRPSAHEPPRRAYLTPSAGPGHVGLSLTGTF